MNIEKLRGWLKRAWKFVRQDVWDIEITSLAGLQRMGVRVVRVVHLVIRGFRHDECPLHASALTYTTLLAVVPILALSLAMARGLGGLEAAQDHIRAGVREWTQSFAPAQEVPTTTGNGVTNAVPTDPNVLAAEDLARQIEDLVEMAFEKVENISFAALGGLGLAMLVWMVISVLGRVESSFNRVWGITKGRTLWRRFTDYLSVLIILPVLVTAASSLPVVDFATRFLPAEAAGTVQAIMGSGFIKRVTVLLMTSLTFTFLLNFMPNKRVRFLPSAAGGFVSGLLFIIWLGLCASIQVGVARYGRIYGSFAVVPILLAWVYVSWQIVLFGAEVAFAVQNCETYHMELGATRASVHARLAVALAVVTEGARRMLAGDAPFDLAACAREHHMSVRLMNETVKELGEAGIVAELSGQGGTYSLLRAPATLTVKEVLDALLSFGEPPEALGLRETEDAIQAVLDKADAGLDAGLGGMTIKALAERQAAA